LNIQAEDDECGWKITEENEECIVPVTTNEKKNLSELQTNTKVEETKNTDVKLEDQLRISLTDFCENNFSTSRRASRNSKSRNNPGSTTVNDKSSSVF
jgi:hypothetical protein